MSQPKLEVPDFIVRGCGPALHDAREEAGLTREQLAEKLGVDPIVIQQVEWGIPAPLSTLYAIGAGLGLTHEQLRERTVAGRRRLGLPLDAHDRIQRAGEEATA
jgi:transcriptional regulator with XRE-family HTH domain